jgi:hypothetical protein
MNGPVWKTYITCPMTISMEGIPVIQHPGGDTLDLNIILSNLDPSIESNTHYDSRDPPNQTGFAAKNYPMSLLSGESCPHTHNQSYPFPLKSTIVIALF